MSWAENTSILLKKYKNGLKNGVFSKNVHIFNPFFCSLLFFLKKFPNPPPSLTLFVFFNFWFCLSCCFSKVLPKLAPNNGGHLKFFTTAAEFSHFFVKNFFHFFTGEFGHFLITNFFDFFAAEFSHLKLVIQK